MPFLPLAFSWSKQTLLLPLLCMLVLDLPASPAVPPVWFDTCSVALFTVSSTAFPSQNPPWSCCYSLHSTEQSFSNHWINSSKWELRSMSCSCDWLTEKGATVRGELVLEAADILSFFHWFYSFEGLMLSCTWSQSIYRKCNFKLNILQY